MFVCCFWLWKIGRQSLQGVGAFVSRLGRRALGVMTSIPYHDGDDDDDGCLGLLWAFWVVRIACFGFGLACRN